MIQIGPDPFTTPLRSSISAALLCPLGLNLVLKAVRLGYVLTCSWSQWLIKINTLFDAKFSLCKSVGSIKYHDWVLVKSKSSRIYFRPKSQMALMPTSKSINYVRYLNITFRVAYDMYIILISFLCEQSRDRSSGGFLSGSYFDKAFPI